MHTDAKNNFFVFLMGKQNKILVGWLNRFVLGGSISCREHNMREQKIKSKNAYVNLTHQIMEHFMIIQTNNLK